MKNDYLPNAAYELLFMKYLKEGLLTLFKSDPERYMKLAAPYKKKCEEMFTMAYSKDRELITAICGVLASAYSSGADSERVKEVIETSLEKEVDYLNKTVLLPSRVYAGNGGAERTVGKILFWKIPYTMYYVLDFLLHGECEWSDVVSLLISIAREDTQITSSMDLSPAHVVLASYKSDDLLYKTCMDAARIYFLDFIKSSAPTCITTLESVREKYDLSLNHTLQIIHGSVVDAHMNKNCRTELHMQNFVTTLFDLYFGYQAAYLFEHDNIDIFKMSRMVSVSKKELRDIVNSTFLEEKFLNDAMFLEKRFLNDGNPFRMMAGFRSSESFKQGGAVLDENFFHRAKNLCYVIVAKYIELLLKKDREKFIREEKIGFVIDADKEMRKQAKSMISELEALKKKVASFEEEKRTLVKDKTDEIKSLRTEIAELNQKLRKKDENIEELNMILDEALSEEEMIVDQNEENDFGEEEFREFIKKYKILIWGARDTKKAKLLDSYPDLDVISSDTRLSVSSARKYDGVIMITSYTSHPDYWAAKKTFRKAEVPKVQMTKNSNDEKYFFQAAQKLLKNFV